MCASQKVRTLQVSNCKLLSRAENQTLKHWNLSSNLRNILGLKPRISNLKTVIFWFTLTGPLMHISIKFWTFSCTFRLAQFGQKKLLFQARKILFSKFWPYWFKTSSLCIVVQRWCVAKYLLIRATRKHANIFSRMERRYRTE